MKFYCTQNSRYMHRPPYRF